MSDSFEVQVRDVNPQLVALRLRGRLDSHSASILMHQCERVRTAGANLVLNLAGVSFIASSGIGALLALAEDFRQAGCQVRLAAVPPAVESVLTLLNLDQFLDMDPSESASIEALKAA